MIDYIEKEGIVRSLLVDGKEETITYIDERKNELISPYNILIGNIIVKNNVKKLLLIGGGGFSIPKYYISNVIDGVIDVVESEQRIVDIAMNQFFVYELIRDYHINQNGRMKNYVENGKKFIQSSDEVYKMVINDAYNAGEMASEILEAQCAESIAKHLSDDGIYLINMFSALEGPKSEIWMSEKSILEKYFSHVDIVQVDSEFSKNTRQNCLVIAEK